MTTKRTPLVAGDGNPSDQGAESENNRKYNTVAHKDSQHQRLLPALQIGPVSTVDAIYDMGIMHPANPVHLLRLQGYNILTALQPATLPDGRETWCAAYYLLPEGVSLADLLATNADGGE